MVCVRVIGIAARSVPVRDLFPRISAVGRAMQIDPATNHVVRIGRMHDNGIAVGHLAFAGEMRAADVLPGVAAVACPENAEHVFVRCRDLKINYVWIRRRHGERRAIELRRRRQTIR